MIKVKQEDGTWKIVTPTTGVQCYLQDEEPESAKEGDFWATSEESEDLVQNIYDSMYPVGCRVVNSNVPAVPSNVTAKWELLYADKFYRTTSNILPYAETRSSSATVTVEDDPTKYDELIIYSMDSGSNIHRSVIKPSDLEYGHPILISGTYNTTVQYTTIIALTSTSIQFGVSNQKLLQVDGVRYDSINTYVRES